MIDKYDVENIMVSSRKWNIIIWQYSCYMRTGNNNNICGSQAPHISGKLVFNFPLRLFSHCTISCRFCLGLVISILQMRETVDIASLCGFNTLLYHARPAASLYLPISLLHPPTLPPASRLTTTTSIYLLDERAKLSDIFYLGDNENIVRLCDSDNSFDYSCAWIDDFN